MAPLEGSGSQSQSQRFRQREVYVDAFRGLMALVMVQGHVCDALLTPAIRATHWYQFQVMFHGSTAPGFLFASGFVAGLPRPPLSLRASLRRGRRLLFVLGTGYALHLPYASFWKCLAAPPEEKLALFACNALQAIAVSQLVVLVLQFFLGKYWPTTALLLFLGILVGGPFVWASHLALSLPPALGTYLDASLGSPFPLFPFSIFVLSGTLAGLALGRRPPDVRRRRTLVLAAFFLALGIALVPVLAERVDFWGVSPAYVLVRLGGLLLLLQGVEVAAQAGLPGIPALAVIGHETLLVYLFHLYLLFGGIVGPAPLGDLVGRLSVARAALVLVGMVPVLYVLAWSWNAVKARAPREAHLIIVFTTSALLFEFVRRPW
jgi:fucose 4-O-acetylase-like acetyltransferase